MTDSHSVSCLAYYRNGMPCRCADLCDLPEEESDGEHVWKFYTLSPELAQEQDAKFLGVCGQCGETKYIMDLPDDAMMAGEGKA